MSSREEILSSVRAAIVASQIAPAPLPERNYRRKGEVLPGSAAVIQEMAEKLADYNVHVVYAKPETAAEVVATAITEAGGSSVVIPDGLSTQISSALSATGQKIFIDSIKEPLSAEQLNQIDAVVTAARVGISLSGTIVLDGEADQGRRAISLIPDTHVIILRAADIYPTVPEAVEVLAKHPTRPLTWIAGPSATADIEVVRVEGVHGPRHVYVVIVSES